jgi:hypothetical protein
LKRTHAFPLMLILTLMTGAAQAEDLPLFKLEMKDGVVSPQRLEVPAGRPFKLGIKNVGKTASEFECKPLKREKVLPPGATIVMEIMSLSSGEYTWVDEFRENLPTGRGLIVAN